LRGELPASLRWRWTGKSPATFRQPGMHNKSRWLRG
jgi:hypothetical protein